MNKEELNVSTPGLLEYTDMLVMAALAEDIGKGDITTGAIVGARKRGHASIRAKEDMIVAGNFVAKKVFTHIDEGLKYTECIGDGKRARKGKIIATVKGRFASILTAERVALNFLQRLSGIATLTSTFVEKAAGRALVMDTRKTTPCMRILERYAVKAGGGFNHRFGLFDAVLIKDNHIVAAGGVGKALLRIKKSAIEGKAIEIEARTLKEVREAVKFGADVILLDNMDLKILKSAVKLIDGRAVTEASGGVTIKNVAAVSRTGVDRISIGALTHSAKAMDISLRMEA
ncbi:MAG: carboxylating nicotinate-nucleotide diphosphorylase [Thermodesulfobacteriota bacterium]